jgi:hypothetical protein
MLDYPKLASLWSALVKRLAINRQLHEHVDPQKAALAHLLKAPQETNCPVNLAWQRAA